ncbi:hypothetical protein Hanom_Chr01g00044771 [Helianthus anomalus]
MSFWDISYVFGEDSNTLYVSKRIFRPDVERGEEEVVSVLHYSDGRVMHVLNDLNQELVDKTKPSYVAQNYPQYENRTYNSHVGEHHKREYKECAKDIEEGDNGEEMGLLKVPEGLDRSLDKIELAR